MVDIAIPLFLVICGLVVLFVKDLMSSIMIFSVYSLMIALEWARLDAVDVAITEAAVGAGISTVLYMIILKRTKSVEKRKKKRGFHIPALILCVGVAVILFYGTVDLPNLRDPGLTPSNHIVPYYMEHAYEETGQENVVAAILAYYRGYDTLGETAVVATAGLCLILMLRRKKHQVYKRSHLESAGTGHEKDLIKRTVTKLLIPFIQLFGLYVIAHGELGPGGGFQGGVIIGVSIILYAIVYGLKRAEQRMTVTAKDTMISAGVLIYGGIGILAILFGGNYLQYNVFLADPKFASTLGILAVEFGIGVTVAGVMITLFYATVRLDDHD